MENKIALVTGAAGGIGAAIVRVLGERGATVAAVDHSEDRLREVADVLTGKGLQVHAFLADVADAESVECVVDAIETRLGPVDYLVNAAGVLRLGAAWQLSDEDWATTLGVNTTGVFHMSRCVVDRMISRSSGAVVTVVSNAAGTARMQMAAYAASKAAAATFTKCLGLEVAGYGIRCNLVAPGSTNTPMLASMWHDETGPELTLDGGLAAYRVGIPLRKLAEPDDIADAVLFLLSDQAAHITMQTITVDGGATLGV
ncbi:2,3-dihydro-2,3-dihydroxybenzoate dehydrogenase [Nocardia sp. NPDC051052]|uniref:2,3-dihydro-2,3-dihydroxybenzoate dehydrogenase n=1 Tax=Nocardia sp. NPDC051052 TaxID=3364322 RepID=UPI0037BAC05C